MYAPKGTTLKGTVAIRTLSVSAFFFMIHFGNFWIAPRKWEDNIKMDFTETGWKCVNFIHLDHDRAKWWAFQNMVMNPRVP